MLKCAQSSIIISMLPVHNFPKKELKLFILKYFKKLLPENLDILKRFQKNRENTRRKQ